MAQTVFCHRCGRKADFEGPVGREAVCEQCNAYLHCCRNCHFYDVTAYNECHESMADRVVDKEQANFCDYFSPAEAGPSTGENSKSKDALERLFKKP